MRRDLMHRCTLMFRISWSFCERDKVNVTGPETSAAASVALEVISGVYVKVDFSPLEVCVSKVYDFVKYLGLIFTFLKF